MRVVIVMRAGTDKWFSGQVSHMVAAHLLNTRRCAVMGVTVKCVSFAHRSHLQKVLDKCSTLFVNKHVNVFFQVLFYKPVKTSQSVGECFF